jgi:hypothetical protein
MNASSIGPVPFLSFFTLASACVALHACSVDEPGWSVSGTIALDAAIRPENFVELCVHAYFGGECTTASHFSCMLGCPGAGTESALADFVFPYSYRLADSGVPGVSDGCVVAWLAPTPECPVPFPTEVVGSRQFPAGPRHNGISDTAGVDFTLSAWTE